MVDFIKPAQEYIVDKATTTANVVNEYIIQQHTHVPKLLKPETLFDKLGELYGKKGGYMARYSGSVLSSGAIIFVVLCGLTYFKIQNDIISIRENWPLERCKPTVMPIAGIVNAPDGMSAIDYTKQNFTDCTVNMVQSIYGKRVAIVYSVMDHVIQIFKNGLSAVNKLREILDRIRNNLKEIFEVVFNTILNITIPIQTILIKVKDFIKKIQGILTTFIYSSLAAYMTLVSLIGAIYEICIIILIAMAIVIAILWALPFVGWALAMAATIIFILIAIPLIIIGVFAAQVMKRRGSSVPKVK